MAQKHTCEPLTGDEYANIFATFQHATGEYEQMFNIISPFIEQLNGSHITLMSIGAGDGYFEDYLVQNKGLMLKYFHAVEPDAFRREELAKTVSKWNTKCFVDDRGFDEAFETEGKFDLILMSHVLYCVPDPLKVVQKAISYLSPGGSLIVFNQTEVGMYAVQKDFFKVANFKSAAFNDHRVTTASISKELKRASIEHKVISRDAGINVTEFIKKSKCPTANHSASFFIQTLFEKLPEDIQNRVYEAVKERCEEDGSGRFHFTHQVGMIIVKNQ